MILVASRNRKQFVELVLFHIRKVEKQFLIRRMSLDTFRPPAVDPAQAPMNIKIKRTVLERVGQALKSVLEKPVVVIMEET